MKYTQTTPCKDCPFLKKFSHAFTLGRLTQLALTEMPCHKTCEIDEDTQDFLPTDKSIACAGAMIFLNKRKDKFTFGFDTSKIDTNAQVR
jgi:hypothetical protein